ncbi:HAD family hydrolase [bacterium]|jgi:import inner membrane translocase subunit TIM50|nr:HAD family hydrolase [bacterium]|tara:strand:+ start:48269 stop:49438 length:1170 start_codon:yes stop_codon:yes gene_type:complete
MFARGAASRLAHLGRAALTAAAAPQMQMGAVGINVSAIAAVSCSRMANATTAARVFGRSSVTRGCASEASAASTKQEPTVISNVVDTVSAAGTAVGALVGCGIGVSWYLQTTDELKKTVDSEAHVPDALKGTPLEQVVDLVFNNLLEFRQWADEQAHTYLDPVSDKLLPDHPPEIQYVPHTLVLDLDDTLILSDWKRERGWRVFKRPGAGDFLKHMAQFYEVVVFSEQLSTYVDPIMERLDPSHFLAGRLYREATQYKNGEYLRDLSKLNRDIGKVIYVTAKPKTAMQGSNVVTINPYRIKEGGETSGTDDTNNLVDTELLDLMPFLESIVRLNVSDVREVLESYKQEQEKTGLSVPEIFRNRQTRFQQNRRKKNSKTGGFSREKKWGR